MVHIDILSDHEILDSILRHLLKKERKMYDWQTLQEELLPDVSAEMVRMYLTRISNDGLLETRPITRAGGFFWFEVNDQTELFLKAGGYKSIFDRQEAENKRLADNQVIEDAKLRSDAKLSKWQVKTFWYVFFGGFITGSTALVLELEDRYSRWQKEQSRQRQSEQHEVSTNSIEPTKQDTQYLHIDTLK